MVRKELGAAERRLAELTGERDELAARLSDPGTAHDARVGIGSRLAEVEGELADAEERWLALAEEAEAAGLV